MTPELRTRAVEGALLAAGRALSVDELVALFEDEDQPPTRQDIRDSIEALRALWEGRALELAEVASGFRMQVRTSHARRMTRLWAERPPRYTRALLETLALIAYRQPVTRGQIEDVRGVSVSTSIVKTLLEREWIRVVGHREVPGRPALYGTTRAFLDHFNLKSLEELPVLQEIRDIEGMVPDLFRGAPVPGLERGDGGEEVHSSAGDDAPEEQAGREERVAASPAERGTPPPSAPTPIHRWRVAAADGTLGTVGGGERHEGGDEGRETGTPG